MKIDYKQLFELNYWFTLNPGFLSDPATIACAVFFTLFILGRVVIAFSPKYSSTHLDKPGTLLVKKINTFLVTMGISGYLLLFFAYQMVPILSMRFLFLLWGLAAVIWAYSIWHFYATDVPRMRSEIEKKAQLGKYSLKK